MKRTALLLVIGLLGVAGCGGDDASNGSSAKDTAAMGTEEQGQAGTRTSGTRISLRESDFGPMLWGPKRQAVYIFQRDGRNRSRCYGQCAEDWPPVFTKAKPVAGRGIKKSLLGTTRRRSGRTQVTYDGKPLYYYSHEGPGEVLCHNVNLNGGLWWVVGRDGRRRP